jgi:WD40 repeat protein
VNEFSGDANAVVQARDIYGNVVLPPASPAPPTPAMAPAMTSGFVHRAEIEQRLVDALRRGDRTVALCGAGGFGKTTLASWACREARDQFPDGVLWVELGQHPSPERVVTSLADLTAALTGTAPGSYAGVSSATSALRAAVADRRVLLVADDVWSATDLAPFLDLGDGVTVLATTRRRNLLGTEIPVDTMTDDEAAALLGRGDTGTLTPLLRRTGHWPLALVLLSGVLRSLVDRHAKTTAEAVTALIDELDGHGIATLDTLSDTDVLRGISRTLDLSLAELTTATVAHLVSLAAFPQGEVVPFWLLRRLWDLSEIQVRAEADRLVDRSLASLPHTDGLRLHDLTREALRHREPDTMAAVSAQLLNTLRPTGGWHELPEDERSFTNGLAYHLRQAGQAEELADLLRDMRYLVTRLAEAGPPGLETDLDSTTDTHAQELATLVRQEGPLLTGRLSRDDIALTLESRIVSRPALLDSVRHVEQARPVDGLVASHPLPDRDDDALLRSFPTHPGGACRAIDWHPGGDLLATVGYGPQLQIVTADDGQQVRSVEISGAVIDGVRWSPDATRLAIIGDKDRFTPRPASPDPDAILPDAVYALSIHDPRTGAEVDATALAGFGYGHTPPDFCWAPDSTALAVVQKGRASLWEPGTGAVPRPLPGADQADLGWRRSLDWHPEHGLLLHCGDGALLRWADPRSQEPPEIWRHPALRGAGKGLSWRPGGRTAALWLDDAALVVAPLAQKILWREGNRMAWGVHWSPDGGRLVTRHAAARPEPLLAVWQVPPDDELSRETQPRLVAEIALGKDHDFADSCGWRPDGSAIATTSNQRVIKLRRPEGPHHTGGDTQWADDLREATWSADGRELAVRTGNSTWFTVDPRHPRATTRESTVTPWPRRYPSMLWLQAIGAVREHESHHHIRAEFAPDERTYALGHWFQPLRVITPGGPVTTLHSEKGHQRWYCICFSPDADQVVAAAADNAWQQTNLTAWPLTGAAEEHPTARWTTDRKAGPGPEIGHVWHVTASRTHVAVIADPGLVGLFRLADLRHLCWIRTNRAVTHAAFDPSGRRLAVVGEAGLYLFWVRAPRPAGPSG